MTKEIQYILKKQHSNEKQKLSDLEFDNLPTFSIFIIMEKPKRILFLDLMRVLALFMMMIVTF